MHALLLLIGWALLVYGWWLVAARPWDSYELWILIVGSTIVFPLLTGFWVLHNVTRYRGRNQRHQVRRVEPRYERDWVGRVIAADWDLLVGAREVRIDVEGSVKHFRPGFAAGRPPGEPTRFARTAPAAVEQRESWQQGSAGGTE